MYKRGAFMKFLSRNLVYKKRIGNINILPAKNTIVAKIEKLKLHRET